MSKTVPRKYQAKGIRKLNHFKGRALLADDMGLGKTFQSLKWLEQYPDALPAVVVCPSIVKAVWEREAARHIGVRVQILEGQKPPELLPLARHQITVINYDILQYWVDYLVDEVRPQTVLIDECHFITNPDAYRSKAVRQVCDGVPHVIAMSGTPLTNRPIELFHIINVIRPDIFPAKVPFAMRYCAPKVGIRGWEYKGACNLGELHGILKRTMMIRRRKVDVLDELPPKTRQVVPMQITDRREYATALTDFMGWLEGKSITKAKKAKRAQALVKAGYLKRLAAELKLKAVIKWVDNWLEGTDGKLVLFAIHKEIIGPLRDHYSKNSVVVDGSVSDKDRRLAVKQFRNKKKCRIFIGNIRAAGAGLDGLQVAETVAFAELDWVPANHMQAEDRIHRIGQLGAAMVYYLIATGTIEETLVKIIQDKQGVCGNVLDGTAEDVSELDVFDLLMQTLEAA